MAGVRNPTPGGRFGLELDGVFAGHLHSAQGGEAVGEVVVESDGVDRVRRKHLGAVRYTDLVLTCGFGMEALFWKWLRESTEGDGDARRSGVVLVGDFNLRVQTRLVFHDALITEIGFPALDGASKEAARLTVRIAATSVRRDKGGGESLKPASGPKQKAALRSNFRVALGALPAQRVAKVEALTMRQAVSTDAVGAVRDPDRQAGALDFSDVVVAVSAADGEAFRAKHEAFVVKGQNGPDDELEGSVELLDPSLQSVLFRVDLLGLGMYALAEPVESDGDAIRRLTARFYCEQMGLVTPDLLGE